MVLAVEWVGMHFWPSGPLQLGSNVMAINGGTAVAQANCLMVSQEFNPSTLHLKEVQGDQNINELRFL
ncbi:hypothetical protein C1884_11955 [Pseudomonas sp. GW460-R15]|nr:hypothetical protein C1887_10605 [Pseudomonas sp. GW456-R21]POA67677.1 hypothetical protein C1884_11955 [Pseudomonas sp. GW460-R15]